MEDKMEEKLKQFLKTIKLNESLLSMIFGIVTVVLVGVLVFRIYQGRRAEITETADTTEQSPVAETMGEVPVEVKEDGKKYPTNLPETYKVGAGEHLWMIAEKTYGSGYNWVEIAKENNLANPGILYEGQELKLPKVAVVEVPGMQATNEISGDTYTVVKGDNLWTICVRAYGDGYKWSEVAEFNKLANASVIEVGQVIKLPR